MDSQKKRFYVEKFNKLIQRAEDPDLDRTVRFITINTLEEIINNPEVFEKFLDFENNVQFFGCNDSAELMDFVSALKTYSEYMIENSLTVSPEQLERMSFFTSKQYDKSPILENEFKDDLNDLVFELLKDFDKLKQLFLMDDFDDIQGFLVVEIKNFLKNPTFKKLITTIQFEKIIRDNYYYMNQLEELNGFKKISADSKIDADLEEIIVKRIKTDKPRPEEITKALSECIIELGLDNGLINEWKRLLAFLLEKYGYDAYYNNAENKNQVLYFQETIVKKIDMPPELDVEYRQITFEERRRELLFSSYEMTDLIQLNPELENTIMQEVNLTGNKTLDAFAIYNALNRHLTYSATMFALDQDKRSPIINSVYNKNIDQYDLSNNQVACKNWSDIYGYLCRKYLECEAYINSNIWHKKVNLVIDDNIITADATNVTVCLEDQTRMTDLTRAKLGIVPAGFTTLFLSPELEEEKRRFLRFDESHLTAECNDYAQKSNVEELMSLIGCENLQDRVLHLEDMSEDEKIIRKISYINGLLSKYNIRNMDVVAYLPIALRTVLTSKENSKVRIHSKLSTPLNEHLDCELRPIITLSLGTDDNKSLFYLIHQDNKGLMKITREQIIEKLESGELRIIREGKTILGLEEYTSDKALVKYGLDSDNPRYQSGLEEQGGETR